MILIYYDIDIYPDAEVSKDLQRQQILSLPIRSLDVPDSLPHSSFPIQYLSRRSLSQGVILVPITFHIMSPRVGATYCDQLGSRQR